jgi:hypothetical protein
LGNPAILSGAYPLPLPYAGKRLKQAQIKDFDMRKLNRKVKNLSNQDVIAGIERMFKAERERKQAKTLKIYRVYSTE